MGGWFGVHASLPYRRSMTAGLLAAVDRSAGRIMEAVVAQGPSLGPAALLFLVPAGIDSNRARRAAALQRRALRYVCFSDEELVGVAHTPGFAVCSAACGSIGHRRHAKLRRVCATREYTDEYAGKSNNGCGGQFRSPRP